MEWLHYFLLKESASRFWSAMVALFCYLTGAAPYLVLVVMSAFNSGNIWNTLQTALFGRYVTSVLNLTSFSAAFKVNAVLIAMNFVNVLLPLAIVGWMNFRKRIGHMPATALGAITLIEVIFAIRYNGAGSIHFLSAITVYDCGGSWYRTGGSIGYFKSHGEMLLL